jgi:hypothetical protein
VLTWPDVVRLAVLWYILAAFSVGGRKHPLGNWDGQSLSSNRTLNPASHLVHVPMWFDARFLSTIASSSIWDKATRLAAFVRCCVQPTRPSEPSCMTGVSPAALETIRAQGRPQLKDQGKGTQFEMPKSSATSMCKDAAYL